MDENKESTSFKLSLNGIFFSKVQSNAGGKSTRGTAAEDDIEEEGEDDEGEDDEAGGSALQAPSASKVASKTSAGGSQNASQSAAGDEEG